MSLRHQHLIRTAAALAMLTLIVTGCSMPRLAYQQADWLLLRAMDSYLALRDEQREQIEVALQTHLARHRREHLPDIAETLDEASARVQRGLAEADVRWSLASGWALFDRTAEFLLPTMASALADLSDEQRQHLARHMSEQADEYAEKFAVDMPAEERWRRDTRHTVKRIEHWTGTLSEEQIAIVDAASRTMPNISPDWFAYMQSRQRALITLLESGAAAPAIEALLREWWIRRGSLPAQLALKRAQRNEARVKLITRLDATLTSMQREHLIDRLQDLAEDARSLMRSS